jgi:hypothetical protein
MSVQPKVGLMDKSSMELTAEVPASPVPEREP